MFFLNIKFFTTLHLSVEPSAPNVHSNELTRYCTLPKLTLKDAGLLSVHTDTRQIKLVIAALHINRHRISKDANLLPEN